MKKKYLLLPFFVLAFLGVFASPPNRYNLLIAPGTLTENSVTLLWDKQYAADTVLYEILLYWKLSGATGKTNYTVSDLLPGAHRLKHVTFTNVKMPENAKVLINDAEQVRFTDVRSAGGVKPEYITNNSTDIVY